MNNDQGKSEPSLSPISRVLGKSWGEKIEVVCRDCGETFDALNLSRLTAVVCPKCGKAREEEEQAAEKLAQEQAEEQRYRALIQLANIPPRWREVTFDTLDPNVQPVAQRLAREYAAGFSKQSPSLVFYSPGNGTGKTTLAACIANFVLHERRVSVMFAKARDIMLEIRKTFSDRYETEAEILDKVSYVDLLLLDDVGVDRPSEWIKSTYWTLMDRRFDWMLPVVVTTNKTFEGRGELLADRIGEGAASRLLGLCQGNVIDMTGPDLR
ncbi:hypothetical protein ES708_29366 [subsurface metagenome]